MANRMAMNSEGKLEKMPKPSTRYKLVDRMAEGSVELWQKGSEDYAVVYGLQMKVGLSYAQAATELGSCLMHGLVSDGRMEYGAK